MIDKIAHVKNPLTIIAMFAAITEIGGTVVLPFIEVENQETFVWFLILFPSFLIGAFFLTLNLNHHVLYAPSDFRNEENYLKGLLRASPAERADKLKEEFKDIQAKPISAATNQEEGASPVAQGISRDPRTRYILSERLVIDRLSREYGENVLPDVRIPIGNEGFIADGLIRRGKEIIIIEIAYVPDLVAVHHRVQRDLDRFLKLYNAQPREVQPDLVLLLAIATDRADQAKKYTAERLKEMIGAVPFPVQIRFFGLDELEKDLEAR